jgi:hypothetical protein
MVTYVLNPTITITSPTPVCLGMPTTLTVSGAASYSWSTGQSSSTISIVPTASTSYTVIGTGSAGCTGQSSVTLLATICEGLNENTASNLIHIYPSPVKQNLFIESPGNSDWGTFTILDVSGHIVYQVGKELFTGNGPLMLDVGFLEKGIYIVKGSYRNQAVTLKFVKE